MPRKPPSHLDLGHARFRVNITSDMKGEEYGDFDSELRLIRIRKGTPPEEQLNTLLHELGHAAWWIDSLGEKDDSDDREERVVRCIANRLSEAMMRSPALRRWIGRL